MSWGIAETAPEIEKIKAESADYLHGLESCGVIDWDTYNDAFDFYENLLMEAYKRGEKDAQPEPCEDAVSRKAVFEAMIEKGQHSRRYRLGETWELNGTEIRETLDTVPSVTPKRKTGKWNTYYHGINETPSFTYSCNQCGCSAPYELYGGKYSQKKWSFCPNCYAKMEE